MKTVSDCFSAKYRRWSYRLFGCFCTNRTTGSNGADVRTCIRARADGNSRANRTARRAKQLCTADSFIELINSFSDAPELDSDAEYDVYYKDLFDQWRAGEAFLLSSRTHPERLDRRPFP